MRRIIIAGLLLVSISAAPVRATVLSSSKIEKCARSRANESFEANCANKIVLTLAVDGGVGATETILAWQTASAPDVAGGAPMSTPRPIEITVRKSTPIIRYPLFYTRNYHAKPEEKVIYTSLFSCRDEANDLQPTCGRAFDSATGRPIPFSEGRCCDCDACELLGICDPDNRGNTRCSLFGDASSAVCLSLANGMWYSGYEIGPAERWFDVEISIKFPLNTSAGGLTTVTSNIRLGPDKIAHNVLDIVNARLVGDFAAFSDSIPIAGSHTLFVPAYPADHPRVAAGASEYMLVPNSLVTEDGRECNKVGVSYEGFAAQGSLCEMPSGSCLKGQLEDLRAEDLARIVAGRTPRYMASGRAEWLAFATSSTSSSSSSGRVAAAQGADSNGNASSSSSRCVDSDFGRERMCRTTLGVDVLPPVVLFGNETAPPPRRAAVALGTAPPTVWLAYSYTGLQASVVTLELNAERVALSVNVAAGRILLVNATQGFEANSREGRVVVLWQSVGELLAQFYLSVHGCAAGSGVMIPAQTVSAPPRVVQRTEFAVNAPLAGVHTCNVTLQDALYRVVDEQRIALVVNETRQIRGAQGGTGSDVTGAATNGPASGSAAEGAASCGSCFVLDPVCMILGGCVWQSVLQIAGALLLAGAIFAAFKLAQWLGLFKWCCGDDGDDADAEADNESKRKKRDAKKKQKKQSRDATSSDTSSGSDAHDCRHRKSRRRRREEDDEAGTSPLALPPIATAATIAAAAPLGYLHPQRKRSCSSSLSSVVVVAAAPRRRSASAEMLYNAHPAPSRRFSRAASPYARFNGN